jgi:hypothetical protein
MASFLVTGGVDTAAPCISQADASDQMPGRTLCLWLWAQDSVRVLVQRRMDHGSLPDFLNPSQPSDEPFGPPFTARCVFLRIGASQGQPSISMLSPAHVSSSCALLQDGEPLATGSAAGVLVAFFLVDVQPGMATLGRNQPRHLCAQCHALEHQRPVGFGST